MDEPVVRHDPRRREVAEDPGAVGVREDEVVEPRHESRRRGRLRIGQRRARQVVQHLPVLVPERAHRQSLERLGDRLQPRHARPLADVLLGRRPVRAEIRGDEPVEGSLRFQRRAADLPARCRVDTATAVAPDPRRRHVDHERVALHPPPEEGRGHALPRMRLEQSAHLVVGQLVSVELRLHLLGELRDLRCRQPRLVRRRPERRGELAPHGHDRPVRAWSRDVQRAALEQCLDEPAAGERLRQLAALESLQPRPEREVRARRRLGLQSAEPLDRLHGAERLALEQQLPLQQRAIQLAPRENTLRAGHRGEASESRPPPLRPCRRLGR